MIWVPCETLVARTTMWGRHGQVLTESAREDACLVLGVQGFGQSHYLFERNCGRGGQENCEVFNASDLHQLRLRA